MLTTRWFRAAISMVIVGAFLSLFAQPVAADPGGSGAPRTAVVPSASAEPGVQVKPIPGGAVAPVTAPGPGGGAPVTKPGPPPRPAHPAPTTPEPGGQSVPPGDLAAAGTGSISGTLRRDVGGTVVSGGCAFVHDGTSWSPCVTTAANGTYTVSALAAGSYRLYFSSPYYENLVSEYYNNTPNWDTAAVIVVGSGALTGYDASLAAGGSISGTLVRDVEGTAVTGMCVDAYGEPYGYRGECVGTSGAYTLRWLPPGSYKLTFSGPSLVREYYNNTLDWSAATPVSVGAGSQVTGINAGLAKGAVISGKVTSQASAAALANVDVYVDGPLDGNGFSTGYYPFEWPTATTAADGTYSVTDAPAGSYRLRFDAPAGYASEYYNDKPSSSTADLVVVAAGGTAAGKNAALAAGATISGRVTRAAGGAAVSAGNVQATSSTGEYFAAQLLGDGSYTLDGLPAGSYKLQFDSFDCCLISEYYNDKLDEAAADPVTVAAGQNRTGVNAALALGGSITGTLVSDVENVGCVKAWPTGTAESNTGYCTNSGDTYEVPALPAGQYTVMAYAIGGGGSFIVKKYYNNVNVEESATPVPVANGQQTTGINFTLAPPVTLSGVVRDASNLPVKGVSVQVPGYPAATTDAAGAYSMAVPTGASTVQAEGICRAPVSKPVTLNANATLNFTVGAFTSACSVVASSWDTLTTTLPLTGDDASTTVTLPFGYQHAGPSYTNAHVSTNGAVNFLAPENTYINTVIPAAEAPNATIYGFWDDLMVDASSAVYGQTLGTAPNRRYVLEWRNVYVLNDVAPVSRFSFQVVLYEDPNLWVRLRYKNNVSGRVSNGSSATVGQENAAGTGGSQLSFNKGLLYDGLSVLAARPK